MAVTLSLEHVAGGCNRVGLSISWGRLGLLAIASHASVLLHDPRTGQTRAAIVGHGGRVTAVRWVSAAADGVQGASAAASRDGAASAGPSELLLTGDQTGTVRLWRVELGAEGSEGQGLARGSGEAQVPRWSLVHELSGAHRDAITGLATWTPPGHALPIVCSVAGTGGVVLWARKESNEEENKGEVGAKAEVGAGACAISGSGEGEGAAQAYAPVACLDSSARHPPICAALVGLPPTGSSDGRSSRFVLAWGGMDGRLTLAAGCALSKGQGRGVGNGAGEGLGEGLGRCDAVVPSASVPVARDVPLAASAAASAGSCAPLSLAPPAVSLSLGPLLRLEGHSEWVKAIDAVVAPAAPDAREDVVLVATASGDRSARVWTVTAPRPLPPGASHLEAAPAPPGEAFDTSTYALGLPGFSQRLDPLTRLAPEPVLQGPLAEAAGVASGDRSATRNDADVRRAQGTSGAPGAPKTSPREAPRARAFACRVRREALLVGHEDWIAGVAWRPVCATSGNEEQVDGDCERGPREAQGHRTPGHDESGPALPQLLTSSFDRTMMVWEQDAGTGLWVTRAALGDAGTQYTGYYGCAWRADGRAVAASGHTGSLHLWQQPRDQEQGPRGVDAEDGSLKSGLDGTNRDASKTEGENDARDSRPPSSASAAWVPAAAPTGHLEAAVDAAWLGPAAPGCLLTASLDRTVRCWKAVSDAQSESANVDEKAPGAAHGQDRGPNPPPEIPAELPSSSRASARSPPSSVSSWREVARPQVHGHDLHALSPIPDASGVARFASCSEEKVIRVFSAPRDFVVAHGGAGRSGEEVQRALRASRGGAVPTALGLSQRAIEDQGEEKEMDAEKKKKGEEEEVSNPDAALEQASDVVPAPCSSSSSSFFVPLEESLAFSTLWPEDRKLYGHVSDVLALAASPSGALLASAARAARADTARGLVWDASRQGAARAAGELPQAHTLSVTRLVWKRLDADARESAHESARPSASPLLLLASVSRDRSIALFAQSRPDPPTDPSAPPPPEFAPFVLLARVEKAHARVLYDAAWSARSALLATVSRDGALKLWRVRVRAGDGDGDGAPRVPDAPPAADLTLAAEVPQGGPARAVAFGSSPAAERFGELLAVGLENGAVRVYGLDPAAEAPEPQLLWETPQTLRHGAGVAKLAWEDDVLASVGDDAAVRFWNVRNG